MINIYWSFSGRHQAAVCELEGFMYVIGGAESWNCLNTVERYNPENNTWTLVAPMNVARRGAGVVVHAGKLTPRSPCWKWLFIFYGAEMCNGSHFLQANCLSLAALTALMHSAVWRCTIQPAMSGRCWAAWLPHAATRGRPCWARPSTLWADSMETTSSTPWKCTTLTPTSGTTAPRPQHPPPSEGRSR